MTLFHPGVHGSDGPRTTRRVERRSFLASLGGSGLGASLWFADRASAAAGSAGAQASLAGSGPGFGRAKRCIFLFMWGGPSQLDTWDPKPEAPEEVRGEFRPIATSQSGVWISEHFPRLSRWAHRYAILRSMTHDDAAHLSSAHHLLTGQYAPKRFSDADPPSSKDFPHLGAMLARLRPTPPDLPSFVAMPWIVSHPAAPGGRAPGQNGGWLGPAYHPFTLSDPSQPNFSPPGMVLPESMSTSRMDERRRLLAHVADATADERFRSGPPAGFEEMSRRAMDLVAGGRARRAFDVAGEPDPVRERYGRNTHGQSVLLARRLAEAGVPLVTVNWHDDGQNFWDTHGDNFNQLKNRLMPASDLAFSALLEDLEGRGLLDETLVVWAGEFGRNPRIDRGSAGRDHWPRCFSVVLAGAGVRGGAVYGTSDRIAAYPREFPTTPGDLAATILHALGVSPEAELHDPLAVPRRLYAGRPIVELFG